MTATLAVLIPATAGVAFLAFAWGLVQVTLATGSWLACLGAMASFAAALQLWQGATLVAVAMAERRGL